MPSVKVKGMHCDNCRRSVTEAVAKVPGIASVDVNLQEAKASWQDADPKSPVLAEQVREAIRRIGFDSE